MDIKKLSDKEKERLFSDLYKDFEAARKVSSKKVSSKKVSSSESDSCEIITEEPKNKIRVRKGTQGQSKEGQLRRGPKPTTARKQTDTLMFRCVNTGLSKDIYEDHLTGKSIAVIAKEKNISKYLVGEALKYERNKNLTL